MDADTLFSVDSISSTAMMGILVAVNIYSIDAIFFFSLDIYFALQDPEYCCAGYADIDSLWVFINILKQHNLNEILSPNWTE